MIRPSPISGPVISASVWLTLVIAFAANAEPQPATRLLTSVDGTRIAFDVAGSGPPVILLHGGGQTRRVWHDAGYVARLSPTFTVITIDIRGNGESDKPTAKASYAIERIVEDVLAVADATGAKRFALWGFSYGANVGRYVAVRSDRVTSMVYIGIPFGAAADPMFRGIILKRIQDGSAPPVVAAWTSALLDYPPVEPADMRAPTLWMVGTKNAAAFDSSKQYESQLAGTKVELTRLEGLTHPEELDRIELTFPKAFDFTRAHNR
jgi:pimeloyl-ACP methyl ester carboxylesterase